MHCGRFPSIFISIALEHFLDVILIVCNWQTNWRRQNERNKRKKTNTLQIIIKNAEYAIFRSTGYSSLAHSCTFVWCASILKRKNKICAILVSFIYIPVYLCAFFVFMNQKRACRSNVLVHWVFFVEELKRTSENVTANFFSYFTNIVVSFYFKAQTR